MSLLDRLDDRLESWLDRLDRFLDDPDRVLEYTRRGIGVAIGLSIASAAVSFGIYYVLRGETLRVYLAAFLFWIGYLFAHYEATGLLLHQGGGDGDLFPMDSMEKLLSTAGIILILVGGTGLPLSVARNDILATNVAVFIAGIGYLIAHYGLTETWL